MKLKLWHGLVLLAVALVLWSLFGKTREGLTTPGPVKPMVSTAVVPPAPKIDPRPIPPPLPDTPKVPVPATPTHAPGVQYNLTCTASPVSSMGSVPAWNVNQPPPM